MRPNLPAANFRAVLASCLAILMSLAVGCASSRVVTVQEELQIGRSQRAQIKRSSKPVRDRAVVLYVRKLGNSLVESGRPSPFNIQFDVIEDDSLNAFATFGGYIFVNTGTILAAESVDELAGVLAHEIGHVNGRHLAKANPVSQRVNFITRLLGLAVAVVSGRAAARNTTAILSQIGATAYVTSFTRDAERESDSLAIETMINAGYDPNALARFFERIKAEGGGRGIPQFLRSHPVPDERIQNVKAQIASSDVPATGTEIEPALSQDQFELVQNRIRLLTGALDESDELSEELEDSAEPEDSEE